MRLKKIGLVLVSVCLASIMVFSACGGNRIIIPNKQAESDALFAQPLAQRIATEGIVMLKNKNNTLPLKLPEEKKLAVFGWSATDKGWIMTGSGSGSGSGAGSVGLRTALEMPQADFRENPAFEGADPIGPNFECFGELFDIGVAFKSSREDVGINNTDLNSLQRMFRLYEPTISADVMNRARQFADVAIMVIGRLGGENKDLPAWQSKATQPNNGGLVVDNNRHYLQLSTEEENLIKQIKAAGFKKFILIVNSCNVMNLDFVEDEETYGIDAVLSVGTPGATGTFGVRRVLNGTDSPSGKTVDTWAYDVRYEPSYNNGGTRGPKRYTEGNNFIEYREDIYVGYRYYETAYADNNRFPDGRTYSSTVQYPFGFGLSYTTFDWTVVSVEPALGTKITADTKFKIGVTVTNTGSMPGKDVVQCYVTAPYKQGEIEKPHVVLTSFAKTETLYPANQVNADEGKYNSQLVYLEFDAYDFASYDCYDKNNNSFTGYELDPGKYQIKIQTDAHNIKTTKGNITTNGILEYQCDGVKFDKVTTMTDLGGNVRELQPAQNYFTNIPGNEAANQHYYGVPIDGGPGTNQTYGTGGGSTGTRIPLMSRETIDTLPQQAQQRNRNYTLPGGNEKPGYNVPVEGAAPAQDQAGSLRLTQGGRLTELGKQLGKNFDDPQWEDLLNQMSTTEMWNLVRDGNYKTVEVPSVGKPKMFDLDGPAGYSDWANGSAISQDIRRSWTTFPSATVIAQTWSRKLAYNFGLAMGKEGYATGVGGWYAPACNLHRNAFEGRNFEYFSEDPLLSGYMSADISYGAHAYGVYTYVKHFVVNETETNRGGLRTWLTEQALRELYLKPFEIAVKKGHATGIMNSFNFLGAIWTGGSVALQQNIVRGEWGFRGAICTDYFDGGGDWMNADQGLRAGTDLWIGAGTPTFDDRNKTAGTILLRRAAKNNLYAFANAWWYEEQMYDSQGNKTYDKSYFTAIFG